MQRTETSGARRDVASDTTNFARIRDAIVYLRSRQAEQPELADLAEHLGLSASHTQRLFSRWAGISPKRFVQYLTVQHAKQRMAETGDLLRLSHDIGLSGSGRLHDLFVGLEAMSPGEFKRAAQGLTITYGVGDTPFGLALAAFTGRGVCQLSFEDENAPRRWIEQLRHRWPAARLTRDDAAACDLLARIFDRAARAEHGGLSVWVSGTNFQIQVWRALLRVPFAGLLSYRQLAGLMGRPTAARAVGSAVARNRVAFLIPCHRVLRGNGALGEYHWGSDRKAALCAWERATAER